MSFRRSSMILFQNLHITIPRRTSLRQTSFLSPVAEWMPRNAFIDQYECVRKLGEGAQAAAYLFKYRHFRRKVEVVAKIYKDTPQNREMVSNEIRVLKYLNATGCHPFLLCFQENFTVPAALLPNICRGKFTSSENVLIVIYDYFFGKGTIDLSQVIEWRFLDDEDYDELDEATQKLVDDVIEKTSNSSFMTSFVLTLIKSVSYLHEHGVAHLDLKPGNAIINMRANAKTGKMKSRIQIIDFGVACMDDMCIPNGTVFYMAPEIAKNIGRSILLPSSTPRLPRESTNASTFRVLPIDVAMKSDAWSVGVLLFEFFFGALPFQFQYTKDSLFYRLPNAKQSDIAVGTFDGIFTDHVLEKTIVYIINAFLKVDHKERLSVIDAKNMLLPWLSIYT